MRVSAITAGLCYRNTVGAVERALVKHTLVCVIVGGFVGVVSEVADKPASHGSDIGVEVGEYAVFAVLYGVVGVRKSESAFVAGIA